MKIHIEDTIRPETVEIADYAQRILDGSDYDCGVVEATQRTADNVVGAVGRLLDTLACKGLLTAEEVVAIVKGWCPVAVKFETGQPSGEE